MPKYTQMRDVLNITRALADSNRLRILVALRHGELCVCQITELLGLAPSTVSKHLAILQQARLIESRKEQRWVFYRWPDGSPGVTVGQGLDWVWKALRNDRRIVGDSKQLKIILRQDPRILCQKQSRK